MKRLIAILISVLLLALLAPPGTRRVTGQADELAATDGHLYRAEKPIPEQYNVVLRNDIRGSELEALAYEFAETYGGQVLRFFYQTSLNGFAMQMKESSALALSRDARVEFVAEVDASKPLLEESKPSETEEEQTPPVEEAAPITEETETKPPVGETTEPPTEEPTPSTEEEITPPGESPSPGNMDELNLVADLPPNPSQNLRLAANPRYFTYGDNNQTIALLGVSGSYLPHVARNRQNPRPNNVYDPVKDNCTYDQVSGALRKYHLCVQALRQAGVNHMQIWVTLNHSVGKLPIEGPDAKPDGREGAPYNHEQPFTWNGQKWNLNTDVVLDGPTLNPNSLGGFNNTFFTRLKEVVQYCQAQGIIVGIVLFDPWSGWKKDCPKGCPSYPGLSPWYAANNTQNLSFTSHPFVVMAEKTDMLESLDGMLSLDNVEIDSSPANKTLRKVQIALMQKTAKELKDLKNFYWVLANEPDMDGRGFGRGMITWHKYMAKRLRLYEQQLLGANRHHLIAVNVSTNPASLTGKPAPTNVIDTLRQDPNIDIINSHYVRLLGPATPVPQAQRYGAMQLLRKWNDYTNAGTPHGFNNKRWGFSEDRSSGNTRYVDGVLVRDDTQWTADNVRVAAWEFLMNGGALYDHLSYRWANPASSNNEAQADLARTYLGYLGKFMNTFLLDGMKRMTVNQTDRWIDNPPPYGPYTADTPDNVFWAAMSNGSEVFLYYMHRSAYKGDGADRYDPHTGGALAGKTMKFQKLGAAGRFKAEWFYPKGEKINSLGGVDTATKLLLPARTACIDTRTVPTRELTPPPYKQDIVLRITRLANNQTCTPS